MNCPEKIAGAYLRLNGFFLLPHFTIFNGVSHKHVDFLALRPPNSKEECNGLVFPNDSDFFSEVDSLFVHSKTLLLGAVVEVKGGEYDREAPDIEHVEYAKKIFGDSCKIIRIAFSNNVDGCRIGADDVVDVSLKHALNWIIKRFDWMEAKKFSLSKEGSWNWSEVFLADLLYLKKLGEL